jgi:hypothetical protein
VKLSRCEYVRGIGPNALGEKIDPLLTDEGGMSYASLDMLKSYSWYACWQNQHCGGMWQCCGIVVTGAGIGFGKGRCVDGFCVMAGLLPEVLLRVCLECVNFVNLSTCWAVGLGAAIIGGASLTHWSVALLLG